MRRTTVTEEMSLAPRQQRQSDLGLRPGMVACHVMFYALKKLDDPPRSPLTTRPDVWRRDAKSPLCSKNQFLSCMRRNKKINWSFFSECTHTHIQKVFGSDVTINSFKNKMFWTKTKVKIWLGLGTNLGVSGYTIIIQRLANHSHFFPLM